MDILIFLYMALGAAIFGIVCSVVAKVKSYFKSVYTTADLYVLKKALDLYELEKRVNSNFFVLRERIEKLEKRKDN